MNLNINIEDIKTPEDLGKFLKNIRQQSNISLEQIHKNTKIRTKHLKSIEKGDFSAIPGGDVYIKGFIKSYARAINVNPDTVVNLYVKIRGEPKEENELPVFQERKKGSLFNDIPIKSIHKALPFITIAAILILALIMFRIFSINYSQNGIKPEKEEPSYTKMDMEQFEHSTTDINGKQEESEVEEIYKKDVMIEIAEDSSSKTVYIIDDDHVEITLDIIDRCWISVLKDGNKDFEGILVEGDTKVWKAEEIINIKIGNPPAVNLIFNGKDMGNLTGTARNFIFKRRT